MNTGANFTFGGPIRFVQTQFGEVQLIKSSKGTYQAIFLGCTSPYMKTPGEAVKHVLRQFSAQAIMDAVESVAEECC